MEDDVITDWKDNDSDDCLLPTSAHERKTDVHDASSSIRTKVVQSSKIHLYDPNWTRHHLVVFMLTFFSYALFHASRKTFSNVKGTIAEEWLAQNLSAYTTNISANTFATKVWSSHHLFDSLDDVHEFMGTLDCAFLFAYAAGLYISGILGDRLEPRLVLSVGMWLTSITVFMFGTLSEWLELYSCYYYMSLWIVSGFVQSMGWPTEVCIMGNWFGKGGRGWLFGIWSACASAGNIIGAVIASHVLPYGYEYAFLVNASLLFAGGIVIFFSLVSAPREIGLPDAVEDISHQDEAEVTSERPKAIEICQAIFLPGVIAYCLAYACLKLVNYSFFFWLPLYLQNNFGWTNEVSDSLSTWYDWGGIVGGLIGGIVTDYMTSRTPVVVSMLFISMFALFGYSKSPKDKLANGALMTVAGFFVGGAANLISAAVAADLGRQPGVAGNAEALATVTGLVDGTGSVGAALGQAVLPALETKIDWMAVFYMFIVMTFLTILCLLPLLIKDVKVWMVALRGRCYSPVPYQEPDPRMSGSRPVLGDGSGIFRDVPFQRQTEAVG